MFHTYSVDQDEDLCPGLDAKGHCETTGLVRTHFRGQGRTFEQTTRKSTLLQFPNIYRVRMKGSVANQFLYSAAHKQPFGGMDTNGLTQRKGMKDMDRRPPAHGVNLEPLAHIRLNVKETASRKRGSDHLDEGVDDDSASPKRVKFEANDIFILHDMQYSVLHDLYSQTLLWRTSSVQTIYQMSTNKTPNLKIGQASHFTLFKAETYLHCIWARSKRRYLIRQCAQ